LPKIFYESKTLNNYIYLMANNTFPQGGRGGNSSSSGNPRYQKNNKFFGPRRNDRIRAPKIRVIGPDGSQIGIMTPYEALGIARKHGLDLLEVSPTAEPPVCRILDYGKYMYEESKRQKSHKSSAPKLKEIKIRPAIDQHDLLTKIRNAEKFLYAGNKLKVTLMMRGREMEYKDLAFETIKKAIAELAHVGVKDSEPKLAGRNITATMSPLPQAQRKLKYSRDTDEMPEDDSAEDSDSDAEE